MTEKLLSEKIHRCFEDGSKINMVEWSDVQKAVVRLKKRTSYKVSGILSPLQHKWLCEVLDKEVFGK